MGRPDMPAAAGGPQQDGSILLPVILLLLVLATAATAMTLQARTSLREAAVRRDRATLAAAADAATTATALALATAAAARTSPPFAIDGTPATCTLGDGRQLDLSVQDEGGVVDLNKANPDLVSMILRRAGLSAPESGALANTIAAHRTDAPQPAAPPANHARQPASLPVAESAPRDFTLPDELGDLPGMDTARFLRLRPLFTTANRSSGIDPAVAAPAIRAAVSAKELASPAFEAMTAPSAHTDFTITAAVTGANGVRFTRQALYRLDPGSGPLGRFVAWSALPLHAVERAGRDDLFCRRVAAALAP